MSSQPQFSKNRKLKLSEKKLKMDLAEMFSGVFANEMQMHKFQLAKRNFNRALDFHRVQPRAKIKTRRILNEFEEFLKVFKK